MFVKYKMTESKFVRDANLAAFLIECRHALYDQVISSIHFLERHALTFTYVYVCRISTPV